MCVIMYKPIGVEPLKKEWLENAVEANRDGWGVLIRNQEGRVTVEKGFDKARFVDWTSNFGADVDVVAHARISTGGKIDVNNLHPFPLFKSREEFTSNEKSDPQAWLFHNGIVNVPEWDKNFCDTWHLARIWESLYGERIGEKMRIKGWRRRQRKGLGDYSKFVLVNSEGVRIINPNAGMWVEGVWHSNDTAIEDPYTYYTTKGQAIMCGSEEDWDLDNRGVWVKDPKDGVWRLDTQEHYWKKQYPNLTAGTDIQILGDKFENECEAEAANYYGLSDPSADNCGGEEFLPNTQEARFFRDSGLDADDVDPEGKIASFGEWKARQDAIESLVDEWNKHRDIESIEQTVYDYDSETIAKAIRYLVRKAF